MEWRIPDSTRLRSCKIYLFLFIWGIDWIIKNKARLILRDGEIQVESGKKGTDIERERIDGNHESGEWAESIDILEDKGEEDREPFRERENINHNLGMDAEAIDTSREEDNLEGTLPMGVENQDELCNRIEFTVEPVKKIIRSISKWTGGKRVKLKTPAFTDEFFEDSRKEIAMRRKRGAFVFQLMCNEEIRSGCLSFVRTSIDERFTGDAAIYRARSSRPGNEWTVPSTVIHVRNG